FESRSLIEFLDGLAGEPVDGRELVRQTARQLDPALKSSKDWERVVHNGFHADSAAAAVTPQLKEFEGPAVSTSWQRPVEVANGELELLFTTDSSVLDGRFANNAWLQELPHPLTKMTWSNAAIMSPKTAAALEVKDNDVVRLEVDGRNIELPVYVQPGQATGSVAVALGYGRTHAGLVGGEVGEGVEPVGVNAGTLRTAGTRHFASGLSVEPSGRREELAVTQDHYAIDRAGLEEIHGRVGELVREGTLDEYREHPDFAQHRVHHPPLESLWTEPSYDGHAWGMAIDLNKCIGCNACVVACQSENNVPVVGPEQVRASREMHWIKVDRYFTGDPEEPEVATQPVTCQHCENAPCEQVCPVAATVHSDEGLNDMVYNRCIGTRYCGNNCPYKVRRFNFLDYRDELAAANRELMQLVHNPEVTVRSRGVMEMCTYCVQRIQNTRIEAKNERRPIGPNEIQTASQQVCASEAIVFGDLNNPESDVSRAHADARAYGMLSELNVKPRTKYLARIRNPHPWLAPPVESTHGHNGHGEHVHADERHGAKVSHNTVPAPAQELREEQV
ncbi:MAG: 4Fe-4S dicluster domain-containing protein, partial [Maioricimonas sp. JB049]